ncbi:hypothetical protein BJ170DRAFT_109075 [Xylariales sp. AK1849]|nr:hypothetical protein BJ170DRAFT_109075 [Xylariales sp. AK1849]
MSPRSTRSAPDGQSSGSSHRATRSSRRRQNERETPRPAEEAAPSDTGSEFIDLGNNRGETPEDINEDDVCPICQLLLHNPVTTTCNHTLCKFCMATWASVSLSTPMTIVDVDEEPVAFDPVSELEARCPMCRANTTAAENPDRADDLRAKYPRTWAEREAEDQGEGLGGEGIQTVTVYIGNRHQAVAPPDDDHAHNQHEWTFFVKPSRTDIIEEVHIFLHPTFRQNHIIRQQAPYQITRIGWGVFTITASVILKAGYSWVSDDARDSPDGAAKGLLSLEWMLDFNGFDGRGSMGRCRLKVKHDRDWDDANGEELRDNREFNRMVRQYVLDGRYEP